MYDYKFRHRELARPSRRRARKLLLRVSGIAIAGAAIYLLLQIVPSFQRQPDAPRSDSDIIPLALPPESAASAAEAPALGIEGLSNAPASVGATQAIRAQAPAPTTAPDQVAVAAEPPPSPPQPAEERKPTWIEHVVEPGDSLARIFRAHGLSPQLLQSILASGDAGAKLERIRPGDELRILLDEDRHFSALHLRLDSLRSIELSTTDDGIVGKLRTKETRAKSTIASGSIAHSLFVDAQKAGLPDAVTMTMASIFKWDIDFALEIRPGDRFTVIYEELWADEELVGPGDILAAEFVNAGRTYKAVRYRDGNGKVGYYTPDGMPLKKTFFRTPVKFTRISSGFSNRRWHPILKRWRSHKGVDYAAPTGTPVMATGDGVVEFAGWKDGYGRVIYLRHGHKYRTVYGHLSKIANNLDKGDRVDQGDVIGYVGQSGLATGPHLHYEFHIDGVHRNPLTVKGPIADPLPPSELRAFRKIAQPLLARLEETSDDRLVADAR